MTDDDVCRIGRLGAATTPNKRAERLTALFAQKPELAPVMPPLIETLAALEAQIARATKMLANAAAADPFPAPILAIQRAESAACDFRSFIGPALRCECPTWDKGVV